MEDAPVYSDTTAVSCSVVGCQVNCCCFSISICPCVNGALQTQSSPLYLHQRGTSTGEIFVNIHFMYQDMFILHCLYTPQYAYSGGRFDTYFCSQYLFICLPVVLSND